MISARPVVVLDSGHGDGGRLGGSTPQPLENELTLDVTRRVRAALGGAATVHLTRDGARNLGLAERAAAARAAGADAFVSIHFNRGADRTRQGTEAWVHERAGGGSEALGRRLQTAVAAATGNPVEPPRRAGLAVLAPGSHAPHTAACLLEVSYVTEPREQARLGDGHYRQRIADAVAGAIRGHLGAAAPARAAMARGLAATPLAWSPVRADELDPTTQTDRFATQTFEVTVPLLTSSGARVPTEVSVFMPRFSVNANFINIHVFWSPGNATETGLTRTPLAQSDVGFNAVMMHGLRGSTDASDWIMIGVPGITGGFVTMDAAGVAACLSAVNNDVPYSGDDIGALRLSAHSRGAAGLAQSLSRGLLPGSKVDRVVIFDAVGAASVNGALATAGVPGSKQFAYQVNDPAQLTARGATNVSLNSPAMRAIGYSRLIADAPAAVAAMGGTVPAFGGTLLPLPARGTFSTRSGPPSGMTDIRAFVTANRAAINTIVAGELGTGGMKRYIDANNLTRLFQSSGPFSPGIMSHHLFVAELAHEIVD